MTNEAIRKLRPALWAGLAMLAIPALLCAWPISTVNADDDKKKPKAAVKKPQPKKKQDPSAGKSKSINEILKPLDTYDNAQLVNYNIPQSLLAGQMASIKIRVKNIGTTIWAPDTYYLSLSATEEPKWQIPIPLTTSVEPNGEKEFTIDVKAPDNAGPYTLQVGMGQKGKPLFGVKNLPSIDVSKQPEDTPGVIGTFLNFVSGIFWWILLLFVAGAILLILLGYIHLPASFRELFRRNEIQSWAAPGSPIYQRIEKVEIAVLENQKLLKDIQREIKNDSPAVRKQENPQAYRQSSLSPVPQPLPVHPANAELNRPPNPVGIQASANTIFHQEQAQSYFMKLISGENVLPEPTYLTIKAGPNSLNDVVNKSPEVTLSEVDYSQGIFVMFRAPGGLDYGWIYPNPDLFYREGAIRAIFPHLTEARFDRLKHGLEAIDPVRASYTSDGVWRVEPRQ